ncbi:MAG: RiPP maturation radical SAM protein 1 [Ectothiorhodospiraceae bacterium]|nr:RiPP maturation radical SAM protein 1 [Ectothiorhodospiraceae bacterium]
MSTRFRVALINPPFAAVHIPSIALTQLRAVLAERFGAEVECDLHYLNHAVARRIGVERYRAVSDSVAATMAGLGEWLYRDSAFPGLDDNADVYLARHAHMLGLDRDAAARWAALRPELDAQLDALVDECDLAGYDVVGLSTMFAQTTASLGVARKIKARRAEVAVVLGGANCEGTMGAAIARNATAIDYVVSGPGLETFPRLVECLRDGERERAAALAGVVTRHHRPTIAGRPVIGAERPIDQPPTLDYRSFLDSLADHCPDVEPSLLFETSRGCWWGERAHCTFCGLNGETMAYRAMSPAVALDHLGRLFADAPTVTSFKSVDNILPREYLRSVLPSLRPPRGARLFYEVKADLKPHEMAVLAGAGVTEIQPGIEALATSTLRLMRKGTSAFQNLSFLKLCLAHGVEPVWNLLVGFPGEDEAVYARYVDMLPALHHLPPPSGAYPVRFDRFSPYHARPEDFGLVLEPYPFYAMVFPFGAGDLADLAYFFADRGDAGDYAVAAGRWLGRLEARVAAWNARWRAPGPPPRLVLGETDGGALVHDTRGATAVEHRLDALSARVLSTLDRPATVARLVERFPDADERSLARCLDALAGRGLVFEEDGRYLGLVTHDAREVGRI